MKLSIAFCPTFLAATSFAAALMSAPAWGQNSLSFISEPGDPVGKGQALTLTGVETYRVNSESLIVVQAFFDSDQWFELFLQAPEGETLRRGSYEDVVRAYTQTGTTQPGLEFWGNNVRCQTIEGRFEIDDIRFGAFGYVERLRAHFEQRCDGSPATLWGDVIIDNPPLPAEMKVRLRVEPQVTLDTRFGYTEAQAYIVVTCEYRTVGTYRATLEQTLGDGTTVRGSIYYNADCGPAPRRIQVERLSGNDGNSFAPGQAILTVEVRMDDPNYARYETDAWVIRQVSRRVRLRE